MSRLFDDALSQYLDVDSVPVAATPLTMACWFNSDTVDLIQYLMTIGTEGANNHRFSLIANGAFGGDPIIVQTRAATAGRADTTIGYSVNTWHHACGVFIASNSRAVYIDGGSKGTDNADKTPAGMDTTSIGRRPDNVQFISGSTAESAIWNAALTDTEAWLLGNRRWSPMMLNIRRKDLVFYVPLARQHGDRDIVGGYHMTAFNAPTWAADPPGIVYPKSHLRSSRKGLLARPSVRHDPFTQRKYGGLFIPPEVLFKGMFRGMEIRMQ